MPVLKMKPTLNGEGGGQGGGEGSNVLIDYDLYSIFKDFETKDYFLSPTKIKQLLVDLGIDITQPIQINTDISGLNELFNVRYYFGGELSDGYELRFITNDAVLIKVEGPTAPFTFESMLDTLAQQQNTPLEISGEFFDSSATLPLSIWVFPNLKDFGVCYSITKAQFISLFDVVDRSE